MPIESKFYKAQKADGGIIIRLTNLGLHEVRTDGEIKEKCVKAAKKAGKPACYVAPFITSTPLIIFDPDGTQSIVTLKGKQEGQGGLAAYNAAKSGHVEDASIAAEVILPDKTVLISGKKLYNSITLMLPATCPLNLEEILKDRAAVQKSKIPMFVEIKQTRYDQSGWGMVYDDGKIIHYQEMSYKKKPLNVLEDAVSKPRPLEGWKLPKKERGGKE